VTWISQRSIAPSP